MNRKLTLLCLSVLLIALCQVTAAAENANNPIYLAKNTQTKQLTVPPELLNNYDTIRLFDMPKADQVREFSDPYGLKPLPFVLLRAYKHGTNDGMVDLWHLVGDEITFLDTIRGDTRPYAQGSIVYEDDDDSSVAFFHVGRGGLWMIDGSTKKVKLVINGLGNIRYFSVINGSLYFTAKERKQLWKSDWTKDGTAMVLEFGGSPTFFNAVTDGFVFQARNRTMYYWDESDGSTNFLPGIEIQECAPSDIAAIQGDNGSKAILAANGVWAIGRHSPRRLAETFGWVNYVGSMNNKVMMEMVESWSNPSTFNVTNGNDIRPMRVALEGGKSGSEAGGVGLFGPFANNAHYFVLGTNFLSMGDADANNAELVATLATEGKFTGFVPLPAENKVLMRGVSKLWEFDGSTNEARLLIDWDKKVYQETKANYQSHPYSNGRDYTWDIVFLFRDGSLLMPMRKTGVRGGETSPLEFWSVQLNAVSDEYNATAINDGAHATPDDSPNAAPMTDDSGAGSPATGEEAPNAAPPTIGEPNSGEPNVDESTSSMVPLVVSQIGTAVLLVLLTVGV